MMLLRSSRGTGEGSTGTSVTVSPAAASAELSMLRVASLAIVCVWPLWLVENLVRCFPRERLYSHGYPLISVGVFGVAILGLFVTLVIGRRRPLIAALRIAAASLIVNLLLLPLREWTGQVNFDGIWFTGTTGVPAVCLALTLPVRSGVPAGCLMIGATTLANALLEGRTGLLNVGGEVCYAILLTLPLMIVAAGTIQVARATDRVEAETGRRNVEAGRARARAAEMTRFMAMVHDSVLSALAGIARGKSPATRLSPVGRFLGAEPGLETVDGGHCADALAAAVVRNTPDCAVTVAAVDAGVRVPGEVSAMMTLALAEVSKNSAKYAGEANRTCRITVREGTVNVTYTDDGPGFDSAEVRPTAAGMRVSVHGRMELLDGGSAQVLSAAGKGTRVILDWSAPPEPDNARDVPRPATAADAGDLGIYDMLCLDLVYSRGMALALAAVFTVMVLVNGNITNPVALVTLTVAYGLLASVMSGRDYPLSRKRTTVVSAGLVLINTVGSWQDPADAAVWSSGWYIMAGAIVACLLALRGRPGSAIAATAAAGTVVEVMRSVTTPPSDFNGGSVISYSVVIFPAVLVTMGARHVSRMLPRARQSLRDAETRAAEVAEIAESRSDNLMKLSTVVGPLFAEVDEVCAAGGSPDDALSERARLTELRLRDSLRSPLLDQPTIQSAAWEARSRGATVRLLDDRSGAVTAASSEERAGIDGDDQTSGLSLDPGLQERIITALRSAEAGDEVTVRLLPPGRAAFASLSDSDGLVRLDATGAPVGEDVVG